MYITKENRERLGRGGTSVRERGGGSESREV